MKQITFIFIFVFICVSVIAQNTEDLVHLKNGSIVKGQITEIVPDKHVKIETTGGSIFVYTFAEIEKIEKKSTKAPSPFVDVSGESTVGYYADYFNKSSVGVAIGGGGLLGLTYRYFPTEKVGVEGGLFYRSAIYEDYNEDIQFSSGLMIAFGPVYYLKVSENGKGKVKKNGMSVKAGIAPVSELNEIMGAVNWVHDSYKLGNKDRYFSFELGAGVIYRYEIPLDAWGEYSTTAPIIYWKLNWFFEI